MSAVTIDPDVVNAWIVAGAGVIAAFTGLYKALQRTINRSVGDRIDRKLDDIKDELKADLLPVKEQARQLGPNGGTHMYDKVNKLVESDKKRGQDISELKDAHNEQADLMRTVVKDLRELREQSTRSQHRGIWPFG